MKLPILTLLLVAACATTPTPEPLPIEYRADDFNGALLTFVIEALQEGAPLNGGIMLSVTDLNGIYWGYTQLDPFTDTYYIAVEAGQPFHSLLDTLGHEWAHAMVWKATECSDVHTGGHGPLWGVAAARTYNLILDAQREYATFVGPRETP